MDDRSRPACPEIPADETEETAAGFWQRAHAHFASAGIVVERVLTDNGSCHESHTWRDLLAGRGIAHKRTRPYRPRTSGRVERFNRTPVEERAHARPHRSEAQEREAFTGWSHHYDHHRLHTAIGGPPASRVPDLSGRYT
ncbi:integrase core domain-containing protein [Nocardiopsis dassonvillei]|uniref:integrase core domain-containing protein n=1 Tax=Nocardiopsis dassonvillei TaxID=2014 RepID=UPI003F54889B